MMSTAMQTLSLFLSHISAHYILEALGAFCTCSPFPFGFSFEFKLCCGWLLKELKLPFCAFTGDAAWQTNKESERLTLLFGVDYILYGIIPKRRSFVVENWANCRVWWYCCTMPQQSCQDEIQLPSTHTKPRRKRRCEHQGGWYQPVESRSRMEKQKSKIQALSLLFCPGL